MELPSENKNKQECLNLVKMLKFLSTSNQLHAVNIDLKPLKYNTKCQEFDEYIKNQPSSNQREILNYANSCVNTITITESYPNYTDGKHGIIILYD